MSQNMEGSKNMSMRGQKIPLRKKTISVRRREIWQLFQNKMKYWIKRQKLMKQSWEIQKVKSRPLLNGEIMRLKSSVIHGEIKDEFIKSTKKKYEVIWLSIDVNWENFNLPIENAKK